MLVVCFIPKNISFYLLKHQSTSVLVQTLKNIFLQNFAANFFLFLLFSTKNAENDYFDQSLECAAPKRWSKYTTVCNIDLFKEMRPDETGPFCLSSKYLADLWCRAAYSGHYMICFFFIVACSLWAKI